MTTDVINSTGIDPAVIADPIQPPVADADEQKSENPVPETDEQNSGSEETPEQKAERKESRRSRARAKDAARLASAETEARLLREQLDRLQAKQPQAETEPKREDFDTLEDYHKAIATHTAKEVARQTIETERKARQELEQKTRSENESKRVGESWNEREQAFMKEAKDYTEVLAPFLDARDGEINDLSQAAKDAILESKHGPQILYRLALDDAAEAERIAKLSPTRQVIEIGKLEDVVIPQKKVSSAPAPVSGVKGRSAVQGYSDNMSSAEFKAWSKTNGAKWAQN